MENEEENFPANMSVLLQFAKFSRGFRISDFDEFVQENIGFQNLDFFGRLAYPNQWQIRLTNRDVRERLIREGRARINNRSCWMYPLNQQEIRGYIHWLPNSVTNELLTEQLRLYGKVLFVESQTRKVKDRELERDTRYYGLILPHGTIKEDLPHFLKINGFMCLVIVRGRQPACIHCKEVGHRRIECPKYKAKLIEYCNRDPHTAPPRLRPRGRRHVESKPEDKDETGRNEVSSSVDVNLEGRVSEGGEILESHLAPALQDQGHTTAVQEEAINTTRKESEESGALVEHTTKSHSSSSALLVPRIEIQKHDIRETLLEIQQRASEDLQNRLKNFEREIVQTFAREKHATQRKINEESGKQTEEPCLLTETCTPVEIQEDFTVETSLKDTKGEEIPPALSTMHGLNVDVVETVKDLLKEMTTDIQSIAETSTSDAHTIEFYLSKLKETKEIAIFTLGNTFEKMEEMIKSMNTIGESTKDSLTDDDSKSTNDEIQSSFGILEQAEKTMEDYISNSFKELVADITNMSSQQNDEKDEVEGELTKDCSTSTNLILEDTRNKMKIILEKTFKKLKRRTQKQGGKSERSTEGSPESENTPKTRDVTKQGAFSTLEQLKQDVVDTIEHFRKEKDVALDAKNIETQSKAETQGENIHTESCYTPISQNICKADEISEPSEKETDAEKAFNEYKELESDVSETSEKDIDELQTNITKIFNSVLAKDDSELLQGTRIILEQIKSEVNTVVEDTKKRIQTNIGDIFVSDLINFKLSKE